MSIKPTKIQLDYMEMELGLFFHFGIRTFYHDHEDWDNKPMSLDKFNPVDLDCDQWMQAVEKAGAKYAVFTCKHHDGFANWPSKYTEYSVKNTPYKDGKGDIVKEYVEACRKHNIKVGLYYSPAQWGDSVSFLKEGTDEAYDDYIINQLGELLNNYGKIDILWLDGCGSEKHKYDLERIHAFIKKAQPDILIFGSVLEPYHTIRGCFNEDGYNVRDNFNMVKKIKNGDDSEELVFRPSECDMRIRESWFDVDYNEKDLKTAETLFGIYEYSVGRGSNLLINLGPNEKGLVHEADICELEKFNNMLKETYANKIEGYGEPFFGDCNCPEDQVIQIRHTEFERGYGGISNRVAVSNRVVIEEDISENGGSIREFKLYAGLPSQKWDSICVYHGETIGRKTICSFPGITAPRFWIRVLKADGDWKIKSIKPYFKKQF